ncbi:MAG: DUF393 domain-containing protein [Planctomycetes bacterium]|nr:DUF393 domain-containing protein [Planctomycetota bacterium]
MTRAPGDMRGWILYDGSCGFCSKWVPFWSSTLARQGLGFAPLQADWVKERIDMTDEELLEDLRLLLATGEVISGPDVYRHVMRRAWWMTPFYLLSIIPGLSHLFDWCYRTFADHRYEVSAACRLPAELTKTDEPD